MIGFFKEVINEDSWTIYLIGDDDNVISDEETAADTDFENKELFFRKSEVSLRAILHELWHVYFGYCYLSDTNSIELDDVNEITAALFSDKGEKIIERAKYIETRLIEIREGRHGQESN